MAKAAALLIAVSMGVACTHASAKLMVDAPKLMTYQPPDIDDVTGIEDSDQAAEAASAQNPHK